jgi:photosystem II stability/assembly factor-like uncharacterized protein
LLGLALLFPAGLRAAEQSEPAPLAARALLLDVACAGERFVAVGHHGVVVVSTDRGANWRQVLVPTRTTLTGVAFPDAKHGWAVGHEGVILVTEDGGDSWRRQDDGRTLDAVYLDVLFLDERRGFIVGAYGRFLHTEDGGRTWQSAKPTEDEIHYNRLTAGTGGQLYIAGESGTVLTSPDQGKSWTRLEIPYDGSLYGVLPFADGDLVAYGLRGNILQSHDRGANWEARSSEMKVIIMGGVCLQSGTLVLGGQGGNFFLSNDGGHSFSHWKPADFGTSVAELIEVSPGEILTVGEAGATRHRLP